MVTFLARNCDSLSATGSATLPEQATCIVPIVVESRILGARDYQEPIVRAVGRFTSVYGANSYAEGGPRSVWEEKPGQAKTSEIRLQLLLVATSEGSDGALVTAAMLVTWLATQQSIGQFLDDSPARMAAVSDSAAPSI